MKPETLISRYESAIKSMTDAWRAIDMPHGNRSATRHVTQAGHELGRTALQARGGALPPNDALLAPALRALPRPDPETTAKIADALEAITADAEPGEGQAPFERLRLAAELVAEELERLPRERPAFGPATTAIATQVENAREKVHNVRWEHWEVLAQVDRFAREVLQAVHAAARAKTRASEAAEEKREHQKVLDYAERLVPIADQYLERNAVDRILIERRALEGQPDREDFDLHVLLLGSDRPKPTAKRRDVAWRLAGAIRDPDAVADVRVETMSTEDFARDRTTAGTVACRFAHEATTLAMNEQGVKHEREADTTCTVSPPDLETQTRTLHEITCRLASLAPQRRETTPNMHLRRCDTMRNAAREAAFASLASQGVQPSSDSRRWHAQALDAERPELARAIAQYAKSDVHNHADTEHMVVHARCAAVLAAAWVRTLPIPEDPSFEARAQAARTARQAGTALALAHEGPMGLRDAFGALAGATEHRALALEEAARQATRNAVRLEEDHSPPQWGITAHAHTTIQHQGEPKGTIEKVLGGHRMALDDGRHSAPGPLETTREEARKAFDPEPVYVAGDGARPEKWEYWLEDVSRPGVALVGSHASARENMVRYKAEELGPQFGPKWRIKVCAGTPEQLTLARQAMRTRHEKEHTRPTRTNEGLG